MIEIAKRLSLTSSAMVWDIAWALALGFISSSLIQGFVSNQTISKRLGKNTVFTTGLATLLGAVSSSCSFAAASIGRTLFSKGATLSNSVAFTIASTNLVFEIFFIILALMGWPFVAGEAAGGICFIAVAAWGLAYLVPKNTVDKARAHTSSLDASTTDHGSKPKAKGAQTTPHSCCDSAAIQLDNSKTQGCSADKKMGGRLKGAAASFYKDVNRVGKDILIGLSIATIIQVVVPVSFWNALFLKHTDPNLWVLSWNAAVGIGVAMLSFVCSCANILLAAALWQGGIHFGGVIAFMLADLITIPMLRIYQTYYGKKTALYLFLILSAGILLTALFVDYSFAALDLIPSPTKSPPTIQGEMGWNYRTVLNALLIPVSLAYYLAGRRQLKAAVLDQPF